MATFALLFLAGCGSRQSPEQIVREATEHFDSQNYARGNEVLNRLDLKDPRTIPTLKRLVMESDSAVSLVAASYLDERTDALSIDDFTAYYERVAPSQASENFANMAVFAEMVAERGESQAKRLLDHVLKHRNPAFEAAIRGLVRDAEEPVLEAMRDQRDLVFYRAVIKADPSRNFSREIVKLIDRFPSSMPASEDLQKIRAWREKQRQRL